MAAIWRRLAIPTLLLAIALVLPGAVRADIPVYGDALNDPAVWAALERAAERELRITARTDKDRVRRRLRRAIYGTTAGPRHRVPPRRADELSGGIPHVARTYALDMVLDEEIRARPRLLISASPRRKRRLVIYHSGHERPVLQTHPRQIEFFLRRGYDVAALSMPLMEFNAPAWIMRDPVCSHLMGVEPLRCLRRPVRPFLAPVAIVLNTVARRYRSVDMVGLSGGGWTTVVAAATDTRIRRSYPVAGTWPRSLLQSVSGGLEYDYPPMLRAASYLDMYALARRQMGIWIDRDDGYFRGPAYRTFVPAVKRANPNFDALADFSTARHEVSSWALAQIERDMRRR